MARMRQRGVTLIEVMVAQVVMAVGLLGAAGLQLRSVQGTDSARMLSQVAFVAHGMQERARSAQGGGGRDEAEFQRQIAAFAGPSGRGVVRGNGLLVSWIDERGGGGERSLELGVSR